VTEKEAIVFLGAIKRGLHKTGKDHPYRDDLIPKMKEALCIAIEEMKAESCKDAISRKSVDALVDELARAISDERLHISRGRSAGEIMQDILDLPSVTPKQKTGRWFYDKSIENWRCSECKKTPKTIGYCGSANFMVEHFKFCNHCGAKMESEDFYENLQKLEDAGGLRLRWQKEKAKWDAERIGEE
jgi:hypothetical protein